VCVETATNTCHEALTDVSCSSFSSGTESVGVTARAGRLKVAVDRNVGKDYNIASKFPFWYVHSFNGNRD
jgi:hypothetical protein